MSIVGFKIDVAHRPGCYMVDRDRGFVLYDGREWDRDSIGRRGGSTMWHRFRCNDPDCPAIALVRWDVISDLIDSKLNEGERA